MYYSGPVHKISSQSVHNFLSNVVHRQTDKRTNRQTNQRCQKHNLLCQLGNNNIPSTIDDANNARDIANKFADRYSDLYKSVPYDVSKMSSITSRIDNLIMSKCVTVDCQFNHIINVSDVTACVKQLKSNKYDGKEGLSSNHIIYCSSSLFSTITALCTAMLHHGYVAPSLRLATIIPIVKDKTESMNDSNNYCFIKHFVKTIG